MTSRELIDGDMPQDSWADAIRDCQAKQLAIISLLVDKGIVLPAEFEVRLVYWKRMLDEELTKRIDQSGVNDDDTA